MSDEEFYEAFYEEALDLLKLLEAEGKVPVSDSF